MKQGKRKDRHFAYQRLFNQRIIQSPCRTPEEVVAHLGAVQAQDYAGAKWSIGLRLPSATEADIEATVAARKIVRTWPQRGTLHFVAAADVRWTLELLSPRLIAGSLRRRTQLEVDDTVLRRAFDTLAAALRDGIVMPRPEVMAVLQKAGINTDVNRGYHILWQAALAGLICFGPLVGKQQSFVLLDEWVPVSHRRMDRDTALAELARRYFTSRGPASLKDFVWWSGLTAAEARSALDSVRSSLASDTVDGVTYWLSPSTPDAPAKIGASFLLPGFDEFLLGYANRSAVLDPSFAERVVPGSNGMFMPTFVIDGRIEGTWKRVINKKEAVIGLSPFTAVTKSKRKSLDTPAAHLGAYSGIPHCIGVNRDRS